MARNTSSSLDEHFSGLRALLVEGEDSGEAEEFDFDGFIAAKKR